MGPASAAGPGRAARAGTVTVAASVNDRAAAQWHGAGPTMVLALAVAFKLGFKVNLKFKLVALAG